MLRQRIRFIFNIFFLSFGLVIIRLGWWQIIQKDELLAQAEKQRHQEKIIAAPRGKILYCDGFPLATNNVSYQIHLFKPEAEKDLSSLAYQLSLLAPSSKKQVVEEERIKGLLESELLWIPLWKKTNQLEMEKIEKAAISGIRSEKEFSRIYPEASQAAQLVGFIGKNSKGDNQGYFGLEGYYNDKLRGKNGRIIQETDALGEPIPLGKSKKIAPQAGADLKLFLNRKIQWIIEKELENGIKKYGAKGGFVIVSDPNNGSILAMASQPNFNPNQYAETEADLFPNPAIAQTFEPGSIFKVFVMASAIDANVVTPQSQCQQCQGPKKIGEYEIHTWNDQYYPQSTMTEIIKNSDNVGMVFVGSQLGKKKLLDYLVKFGFDRKTNIDLQGEMNAIFKKPYQWYPIDLATATFGQGIAVTGIQTIQALNVLANGGVRITPRIVETIELAKGNQKVPQEKEKIISAETARQVTQMMVEAVQHGEAQWTNIANTQIAGKTGTAQIPLKGHYDENRTVASFIGFAPAYQAKFSMLVTLFEPSSSPWASETAAPLWFNIAEKIFLLNSINPRKD